MFMGREIGGEGASAPWIRSEVAPATGLVVCPMFSAEAGMDASMVQEIYRMAYERARAASRPSAYEIAHRICWN
jgi:hypothetical protein